MDDEKLEEQGEGQPRRNLDEVFRRIHEQETAQRARDERISTALSRRLAPGDPVGSLAADLCETAICEAMPPDEILATARACREAAEICYGQPPRVYVGQPAPPGEWSRPDDPRSFDPIPPPPAGVEGAQAIMPVSETLPIREPKAEVLEGIAAQMRRSEGEAE